ncbi:hypothetical protein ABZ354_21025, partial [Streptomyces sp. NPDC005925]|uniref:hypothetical protein n=1 Tax=Streptomyces sp. NPDC005925 TaxID=3157172 RepID=UPI0033D02CD3
MAGDAREGDEVFADFLALSCSETRVSRVPADRRPPTADRRPPTADRRPPTADRRPPTADRRP